MDFLTELQVRFFENRGHIYAIVVIVLLFALSTWVSMG